MDKFTADVDFTRPEIPWLKSNRSWVEECVEVAKVDGIIGVRDSKNPHGPVLRFNEAEWAAFIGGVRDGDFDQLG